MTRIFPPHFNSYIDSQIISIEELPVFVKKHFLNFPWKQKYFNYLYDLFTCKSYKNVPSVNIINHYVSKKLESMGWVNSFNLINCIFKLQTLPKQYEISNCN